MNDGIERIHEEIINSIKSLQTADKLLSDKLEPLMTISEVAEFYHVTPQYVRKLESYGRINRVNLPGVIRFRKSDVVSFIIDTSK
jgi:predicted transcriptional regulator of viral defense system